LVGWCVLFKGFAAAAVAAVAVAVILVPSLLSL
jgi:hypothetical protein